MRPIAKLLIAVGVVGVVVFLYWNSRSVLADGSRKSRFIRTYDAALGVKEFGRIRESTGGEVSAAGSYGVWNSREILMHVAVDGSRVAALLEAMQRNVRDTLSRTGSRFEGGGSTGPNTNIGHVTYRSRYEESNATGVIRIGPAYRDVSRSNGSETFIVPIWIEEQWLAK
jgi:hypothetical protein